MARFAVIGLGRFGSHLAKMLAKSGEEVMAIDRRSDCVEVLRDAVAHAVCLDATDRTALESQGIGSVDVAVIGIGEDFEDAAITVATLKEMGVPRIIARAMTSMQARILDKVGADEVVSPERESAQRWAHRLSLPNLEQYVELGEGYSMVYMRAPKPFWDKTLQELELRHKYNINLIAIRRTIAVTEEGERRAIKREIVSVPQAGTKILQEDVLIMVGANESLSDLPTG